MASEALEEKKPEEEAPVEDKQEVEAEEDEEKEDLPEVPEKATENEEGEETPKKGKRTRRASSKSQTESKKQRGGDSAVKNPKKEAEVEKKEKEPVTPVSERPTRERKVVERYSAPESGRSSATKPLNIEKGRGTQLKDIPNVAFKLSKRKPDDNLQLLHTILFGKKAKSHSLKRNIVQFSGYVWAENEQEKQRTRVKEKLDKCVKEKLMDFCDVLNIQINKAGTKKEELSAKLLEFLESPHATTDVLLAEKEQKGQKRKKKVTPSKIAGSGEGSPETPAKKLKDTPSVEKNEESTKDEEDEFDDKVEPSEEDDDDRMNEETDHGDKSDEEEDEPKDQVSSPKSSSKDVKEGSKVKTGGKSTPAKKKTPAKSVKTSTESEKKSRSTSKRGASDADGASGSKAKGSVKKQKTEKESPKDSKAKTTSKKQSSKSPAKVPAKDQVKGKTSKKAKTEPTKEDVHAVIVDILKEVDFNTATLSDILRQLGTHFGIDLMHRKAEVKDIITDVINNMTDEEEEDEEEEAAGDDSEKEDHDDA
ncbi:DEK domain-containing chromatin-associated protein 1 [Rosa rugosa]|uniref:DEK domain-containing chromatin-associated protein 1 n=1 Tax=Rosa rugosa TaxID=74645 RepID=UPI002B4042E4|nr:DEK domain-containing chromatin-associated protein 1 [Rosa rugosa]